MGRDVRPDGGDDGVPHILVRAAAGGAVDRVERGIEEEGVPWVVRSDATGDAASVAHEAAKESPLKIGVSVIDDRIVVHHKQLPAERPLFDAEEVSPETARRLGSNAARLAKGTPLKPID